MLSVIQTNFCLQYFLIEIEREIERKKERERDRERGRERKRKRAIENKGELNIFIFY